MPTPSTARLVHYAALYFAQGTILSYFLTFNVLYLRDHGFAAADIGFFQATLVLPFVLKILLGMLSDRVNLFGLGHRHPYIVLGLLLQGVSFALLPGVTLPDGLATFFVLAMLAAVGMALYDTSTDGLAVESTPADERPRVQATMVAARAAGILFALLAGAWLVGTRGWPAVFWLVAVLTVPGLLLTLLAWRPAVTRRPAGFAWDAFAALLQRDNLALAAMGALYALALDGVLTYLSYHADADNVADIGMVSGLVALSMVGRILGAGANAPLAARLGQRVNLQLAIVTSAAACLALAAAVGVVLLAAACVVFGFAYGHFTAAYAAAAMGRSDPRIAASMFAIFMMFLNIGIALGQTVGGSITQAAGFAALAVLMAALVLLALPLARRVTR
ncbi:MAG: MFS transporter [Gammaproteobacteria bacterium]|nr:MFS transporter [Gammaproteobacteria bacterium]